MRKGGGGEVDASRAGGKITIYVDKNGGQISSKTWQDHSTIGMLAV